jgi:hypothetical protein
MEESKCRGVHTFDSQLRREREEQRLRLVGGRVSGDTVLTRASQPPDEKEVHPFTYTARFRV